MALSISIIPIPSCKEGKIIVKQTNENSTITQTASPYIDLAHIFHNAFIDMEIVILHVSMEKQFELTLAEHWIASVQSKPTIWNKDNIINVGLLDEWKHICLLMMNDHTIRQMHNHSEIMVKNQGFSKKISFNSLSLILFLRNGEAWTIYFSSDNKILMILKYTKAIID